jgi:hypothetical protein
MTSFSGKDYDKLFELGTVLYTTSHWNDVRAIGTTLMDMAESVRGQYSTRSVEAARPYRIYTAPLKLTPQKKG